ncbi:Ig-like domain-containing protein, partial [Aliivibrio fischeri]|uniref:Ig-like domain-containing protein n=1 Tax=Aliivibrio fischeri TaxID=668 RepID=UPI0018C4DA6D
GRLSVTVAALESIQITPAEVSLAKGTGQQYTAVGFYSDDTSRELTREVSWRSRDTSIATISVVGLAVGVGVGNSTISAVKDGVVSNDGMLTIVVEDISFHLNVTPKNTFIPFVGGRQKFKAELVYNDGRIEDVTSSVIWQSSATDVAVIDQAGIATSVSLLENATRIQAILKSNTNIWAETLLHVSKSRPISISINIVDGTQVLNVGEQQKYILIGIFDIVGGRFFDLSYSAEWISSDTSVIQMIGPVARAIGSGKATITVRYQDERENTLQLTVR